MTSPRWATMVRTMAPDVASRRSTDPGAPTARVAIRSSRPQATGPPVPAKVWSTREATIARWSASVASRSTTSGRATKRASLTASMASRMARSGSTSRSANAAAASFLTRATPASWVAFCSCPTAKSVSEVATMVATARTAARARIGTAIALELLLSTTAHPVSLLALPLVEAGLEVGTFGAPDREVRGRPQGHLFKAAPRMRSWIRSAARHSAAETASRRSWRRTPARHRSTRAGDPGRSRGPHGRTRPSARGRGLPVERQQSVAAGGLQDSSFASRSTSSASSSLRGTRRRVSGRPSPSVTRRRKT